MTCPSNTEFAGGSALCPCSAGFTGADGGPCVARVVGPTATDASTAVTVTFKASLQISATEFLGKQGDYIAGVAAALGRAEADVSVVSVVEVVSRRRLLALSVLVETAVLVAAEEADAVAGAVTAAILNDALAAHDMTVSEVTDVQVLLLLLYSRSRS